MCALVSGSVYEPEVRNDVLHRHHMRSEGGQTKDAHSITTHVPYVRVMLRSVQLRFIHRNVPHVVPQTHFPHLAPKWSWQRGQRQSLHEVEQVGPLLQQRSSTLARNIRHDGQLAPHRTSVCTSLVSNGLYSFVQPLRRRLAEALVLFLVREDSTLYRRNKPSLFSWSEIGKECERLVLAASTELCVDLQDHPCHGIAPLARRAQLRHK
jgi:hypothetical protein